MQSGQLNGEEFKKKFKKRLYDFTLKLIKSLESLEKDFTGRRLADQLLRSGTSILANYLEGQSSRSKKDLVNYITHAFKSSNESKLWISLLKDLSKMKEEEAKWFLSELEEYSKIFSSSILTLKEQLKKAKKES